MEETLLRQILAEFKGVNSRLDGIERRLDRVESRLENVERRLDRVESRLENVESRLDQVESRLENVESRLDQVEDHLGQLDRKTNSIFKETAGLLEFRTQSDEKLRKLENHQHKIEIQAKTEKAAI